MSYSISIEREPEYVFIKSIYIPRIFENITSEKIKYAFEILDLGIVSYIDLVQRGPSKSKMAFVHFSEWSTNPSAQNLARKILDPNSQAKLVYDDPWYWILLPNNKPIGLPREETIQGLKQMVSDYKLIIDDLEAQLFETWKQDIHEEKEVCTVSPVYSTSSWEISDFDDKKDSDVQSLASTSTGAVEQKIIGTVPNSKQNGFVASISNWHSENKREFLGHVKFEHLHKQIPYEQFYDLELGLKNQYSSTYAKIVPIQSGNYDESIISNNNTSLSDAMFDSKGNKYIKKDGKWFRIEERKVEQNFWCDP